MKLSEKILQLRKQHGMSQEDLAEKLNVSRQAVSRWEVGSAQPDASNVLQLSRLFEVTADYLLNDAYESDQDVPAVKNQEISARRKVRRIFALCVSAFGLSGNFVIYILSRFTRVMIPYITYKNGEKWYRWSDGLTGYSYKYFIQQYNLEFLTVIFWILFAAGLIFAFVDGKKLREAVGKYKAKRQSKAKKEDAVKQKTDL